MQGFVAMFYSPNYFNSLANITSWEIDGETLETVAANITSWEIDGETVETVSDFIWGGSKITADGDCSHEIERRLLLGRKVTTNLDSIFKSRDITLPTKVHLWFFQLSCMDVSIGL